MMYKTLEQYCKEAGLLKKGVTFDYAIPQAWSTYVDKTTGLYPRGIVWLYDQKSKIFGRPFAVTFYGYLILRILALTKKEVI